MTMYLNEFDATLKQIQGKWKILILYKISDDSVVRFNQLGRFIGKVSNKTLTNQLRELEEDQLISRKIYPTIPSKVEYRLTEKGASLIPLLNHICEWGLKYTDPQKIENKLCDSSSI